MLLKQSRQWDAIRIGLLFPLWHKCVVRIDADPAQNHAQLGCLETSGNEKRIHKLVVYGYPLAFQSVNGGNKFWSDFVWMLNVCDDADIAASGFTQTSQHTSQLRSDTHRNRHGCTGPDPDQLYVGHIGQPVQYIEEHIVPHPKRITSSNQNLAQCRVIGDVADRSIEVLRARKSIRRHCFVDFPVSLAIHANLRACVIRL